MSKLNLKQIRIDPSLALGRRGCICESGKTQFSLEYFQGTPFDEYLNTIEDDTLTSKKSEVVRLVQTRFQDIVSICRKSSKKEINIESLDKELLNKLVEFKILDKDYNLLKKIESFGNLLECIVCYSLESCGIQSMREVKVKYPFTSNPYDPDGQLYDVIGALDISKLIWIECKKPLYLNNDKPLGQVISKDNIEKFIRRANLLKPDIAIYLVDTKEDYSQNLRNIFNPQFLSRGNYIDSFQGYENIIARLDGFMYFNRICYKSNSLFYDGLQNSVYQVLHDSINQYNKTTTSSIFR
jgi:hypothetical protein